MNLNPGRLRFDPIFQEIDNRLFEDHSKVMYQWREFYLEAIKKFPHGMTETLVETIQMICYVYANHAKNILNRQHHSGILIFFNNTPAIRYYKRHNTVEQYYFGSEFLALRTDNEFK